MRVFWTLVAQYRVTEPDAHDFGSSAIISKSDEHTVFGATRHPPACHKPF